MTPNTQQYFIPRFPQRFAMWLCEGENPFTLTQEQLIWFAMLINEAEEYGEQ
jgi:hypothetical protein